MRCLSFRLEYGRTYQRETRVESAVQRTRAILLGRYSVFSLFDGHIHLNLR